MSDFILPTEKVAAIRKSPKSLLIYAPPKAGKTTLLSYLDKCLILDFEQGTDLIDALKVDLVGIAAEQGLDNPLPVLNQVLQKVKSENADYDYCAIDTVTALEEHALVYAKAMYQATPIGKNFDKHNEGKLVTELPNGAGYYWLRLAFFKICSGIEKVFPKVIYVGHLREKLIETKDGKEISANDIDLTGKIKSILASKCDAIGFLYRDKENTMLNFKSDEKNSAVGARCEHLRGEEIILAVSEGAKIKSVHWDRIYVD
jgi:hypothetical protein